MNKLSKSLITLAMLATMIGVSVIFKEPEIIFPEITALCVGAWVADKQPWRVKPSVLCALITISAFLGIIIVRADFLPILVKICIGFTIVSISLIVCDSTFVPMISACILPILMGTTSIIYPISVSAMSVIIVGVQRLLNGKQTYIKNKNIEYNKQFILFYKRLVCVLILSIFPVYLKEYFFIAPPLIVAFVELTNIDSKPRKHPYKLLALMAVSSFSGAYIRLIFTESLGISLIVSAIIATGITLLVMSKFSLYFPPAGAISTLPMIIPSSKLILFPLEVIIGFSIMVFIAITVFRPVKEREISYDKEIQKA